MKKLLAIMLAVLMVLSLCACQEEKELISEKEAMDAALAHAGYKIQDVTNIHVHKSNYKDTVVYSIYFSHGTDSYSLVVDGYSAEILDIDIPHGH